MKQIFTYITFTSIIFFSNTLFGQDENNSDLFKTLAKNDTLLFGVGFNECDISQFEKFLDEDAEFYHDQSGINNSKENFILGIKDGLCKMDYKAIRKLDKESLKVFPMKNNGKLYGAVQTGIHRFYAKYPDKDEFITSTAMFTHLWLLKDGEWKLARVLSFDHH